MKSYKKVLRFFIPDEYKFYTIETVANILGIEPKVLLVIIDELVVFGKSKKNQN